MPCDIGYKSFSTVAIPAPQPMAFRQKAEAPKVDAELMERIGQDDPGFVEWMQDYDMDPLLREALKHALKKTGDIGALSFSIKDGTLAAEGSCTSATQKRQFEEIAERVGRRWQMEVLAIVVELLNFTAKVTVTKVDGKETLILEAEKHGGQVSEYIRVSSDPERGASMLFEHFASAKERDLTRAKFVALAQRLGVRIAIGETRESGSPIPSGTVHKGHIKGGES